MAKAPNSTSKRISLPRGPRKKSDIPKIKAIQATIIGHIKAGNYRYVAACAEGIAKSTMQDWLENDSDFLRDVECAESQAEVRNNGRVNSGEKNWQSSAWWLERKRTNEKRWTEQKQEIEPPPQQSPEDLARSVAEHVRLQTPIGKLIEAALAAKPAEPPAEPPPATPAEQPVGVC